MSNSPGGPRSGPSALFSFTGLPAEVKVSFWIWFVGGILSLMGSVLAMLAFLVLFAAAPAAATAVMLLMLLAAAAASAQMVFAFKMKAGRPWARMALTGLTAVTLVLAFGNNTLGTDMAGNWVAFLVALAATVLMWLPRAQAWFRGTPRRNTSAE